MASDAPQLLIGGEHNGHRHADLYHSLADQFHQGVGSMLNAVLARHQVGDDQRRQIVGTFLFELMAALDNAASVQLGDQAFDAYPDLRAQEPDAARPWHVALAFLQRDMESTDTDREWPGVVRQVLLCTDTWLHEVCGDWLDPYFEGGARS